LGFFTEKGDKIWGCNSDWDTGLADFTRREWGNATLKETEIREFQRQKCTKKITLPYRVFKISWHLMQVTSYFKHLHWVLFVQSLLIGHFVSPT